MSGSRRNASQAHPCGIGSNTTSSRQAISYEEAFRRPNASDPTVGATLCNPICVSLVSLTCLGGSPLLTITVQPLSRPKRVILSRGTLDLGIMLCLQKPCWTLSTSTLALDSRASTPTQRQISLCRRHSTVAWKTSWQEIQFLTRGVPRNLQHRSRHSHHLWLHSQIQPTTSILVVLAPSGNQSGLVNNSTSLRRGGREDVQSRGQGRFPSGQLQVGRDRLRKSGCPGSSTSTPGSSSFRQASHTRPKLLTSRLDTAWHPVPKRAVQ